MWQDIGKKGLNFSLSCIESVGKPRNKNYTFSRSKNGPVCDIQVARRATLGNICWALPVYYEELTKGKARATFEVFI